MTKLQTPLAYLWAELDTLLNEATIAELRRRVAVHTDRYNRAAKLRQAERELALFERIITTAGPGSTKYKRYAVKIDRRKARIAALQDEQNVIG